MHRNYWFVLSEDDASVKVNSHIQCRSHVAPMPFPCHAVPLKGFRLCLSHLIHTVRPYLIHNAMPRPWRTRDMPLPCRSESDFSRPRHSAVWAWHGICELASTVHRQQVEDLPAFGFFRVARGVL
jgi:hypothetical protein